MSRTARPVFNFPSITLHAKKASRSGRGATFSSLITRRGLRVVAFLRRALLFAVSQYMRRDIADVAGDAPRLASLALLYFAVLCLRLRVPNAPFYSFTWTAKLRFAV